MAKFFVESENGHDEFDVDKESVQGRVEAELTSNKWVTLEHNDGSTELLSKKDLPNEVEEDEDEDDEEDEELVSLFKDTSKSASKKTSTPSTPRDEWVNKFEDVKTATVTHKTKGG